MLTDEIRQEAEQHGILDLAEKLYASVSVMDGVYGVTFDFSDWEPDFPVLKIITKHRMPADYTLRQRHRIVRPIEKVIKGFGLLETQWYGMDDEHLYFYYRAKTEHDYTLYASDFGLAFIPTEGELQQLQTEFAAWDGDKEKFLNDLRHRSREIDFYKARADVIAQLQDQLAEKDRRIAELEAALKAAQNK